MTTRSRRSSPSARKLGCQRPTARVAPEYETNDGKDATDFLTRGGNELFPWQEGILWDWLGRDALGMWAASVCGLSVARQNGKTNDVGGRAGYGMTVLGELVVYTAHLQTTATETFEELAELFESAALKKYVKDIKSALGREQIILKNGARMKFFARTRNGGRGKHGDLLIFDEAQELTSEQQASFLPAVAASSNPQTIYLGTPPDVGADGKVFSKIRSDALAGKTRRTAWAEWGVPTVGDKHDKRRWYATNPSLGYLIKESTIEGEAEQMDDEKFARERLGYWREGVTDPVFDRAKWAECLVSSPEGGGLVSYGVKFSVDGARVSICAAVRYDDGPMLVELVASRSMKHGITWIVDWACRVWRDTVRITIDGKSHAQELADELKARKVGAVAYTLASSGDAAAAASMLVTAVNERKIRHIDQRQLTKAVEQASKRMIGNAGGFGFKAPEGVDVTPVEAASLALHGAKTSRRNPKRKMRVG